MDLLLRRETYYGPFFFRGDFALVAGIEDGHHALVVAGSDGVELVVVAAGATEAKQRLKKRITQAGVDPAM